MSIELEKAALEACGYNVRVKERNGSQWIVAWKQGENQAYAQHWHPLTNINQAMQLLSDCPTHLAASTDRYGCLVGSYAGAVYGLPCSGLELISAQCEAIVKACASLKGVR